MFNLLKELVECKKDIEEMIKQYVIFIDLLKSKCTKQISKIDNSVYDYNSGSQWLNELSMIYIKCGGNLPCTPYQMMNMFKEKIEEMSDSDFFTVTHHIEHKLNNKNFKTIVQSFTHWLSTNKATLHCDMRDCFFGI